MTVQYNPQIALVSPFVIAVYPGSFDPITLGHLDIIQRSCRLFEKVIVVVMLNPGKTPLFSIPKRLEQIRLATRHLPNVEVDSFDGLTVTYARMRQAKVLLRGLRVLSDFEKELQMAHTNKTLSDDVETFFLATSNEYSFLSSSLVKEIAKFGGPVDHLVPPTVALDIRQCFAKTLPTVTLTATETATRMELHSPMEPPRMEGPLPPMETPTE